MVWRVPSSQIDYREKGTLIILKTLLVCWYVPEIEATFSWGDQSVKNCLVLIDLLASPLMHRVTLSWWFELVILGFDLGHVEGKWQTTPQDHPTTGTDSTNEGLAERRVFYSGPGLWDQGVYPHFCDTRESPL